MSAIRNAGRLISGTARFSLVGFSPSPPARSVFRSAERAISSYPPRCAAAAPDATHLEKKLPRRRLGKVYNFLLQDGSGLFANKEVIPKITLNHVSVSFTGQGESTSKAKPTTEANTKAHKKRASPSSKKKGKNPNTNASAEAKPRIRSINTAGTRVVLRLDVQNASWLNERVRERIMLMVHITHITRSYGGGGAGWLPCVFVQASNLEKDRIKDGKLELTSSKTRKQENNYEEAVSKMNKLLEKFQAIINAASYSPLPTPKKVLDKIANASTHEDHILCDAI
ncbi:unnamed protein product [Cuscuta campestris]|uniref:Prokaryotic-type class I peptide chain release factors domain-containing protein n=1 Tax=Cuscuta campestris TaxID=132261 RepID=A0A484MXV8_9ASTE|nr:unnamed protein product [Cuscuta campestris]